MKRIKILFQFILITSFIPLFAQQEIKVMSYNIRLDVASDGENRWDARKEKAAGLMTYYGADFIGSQEVQHHQLQYLVAALKHYGYIGVGRDDGKEAGEYSCIFYNSKKFDLIQQSTFWLSPTPDSVSMGWDAACKRVCTYGLFQSRQTKQLFWVLNTHLDHMGATARIESVKLIADRITQFTKDKKYPLLLTGDFNSKPGEAPAVFISNILQNTRMISEAPAYGPEDTWNAFQFNKKPDGCIDYIFISRNNKWAVKKFATITDSYELKYPSDHFPVMATLELN